VGAGAAAGSRAEVHQRFMAAAQAWQGPRPARLPRRVIVFGLSALPQQTLEALAALGRWCQVLMCVHNPCRHDWSHTLPDRDLLCAAHHRQRRRAGSEGPVAEDALHLHAHPLLSAWGRQGRDFIRLLDAHDDLQAYAGRFAAIGQRVDCFDENVQVRTDGAKDAGGGPEDGAPHSHTGRGPTLLHQLQDDVLDLRPLAEAQAHQRVLNPQADHTLRFHVTHGPLREVEVLHDRLLSAFAADPTLRPRDVLVMVPDIQAYAPLVQAVFGQAGEAARAGQGDRPDPASRLRRIPFTVVDRGLRHQDPIMGALERLLGLPGGRLGASEVQDLLQVPALRRRFDIDEAQLPQVLRWVQQAGIRWGLHAEHRAALGLPPGLDHNTWTLGLKRLLLGYAVGAVPTAQTGTTEPWQGLEPVDEVGGLDAALLGPLAQLVQALERHWQELSDPAPPAAWGPRLRALLQDFFLPAGGTEALLLQRLEAALQAWLQACEAAALDEPLPLSVVREHWLAQMDSGGLGSPFFGGGVTFATLMPMRAIPFRFVALLGMNDGDYPRSRVAPDFDLMAQDPRPGDRSRREDDRYLFLEALLSAREHLHLSWVGRSIHDNEERPPSALVAQLRDHLAAIWRLAGDERPRAEAGSALLKALTVEHPLQPFSPAYFAKGGPPELFSHAREWREALMAREAREAREPHEPHETREAHEVAQHLPSTGSVTAAALPPLPRDTPLSLLELAAFLRDPIGQFFEQRLGIRLREDDDDTPDHEPFSLDALENWQLQDQLIQAQKAAVAAGTPTGEALQSALDRLTRSGVLPPGAFGSLAQQALAEPMEALFAEWQRQLQAWPHIAPDEPCTWPDAPVQVSDQLTGLRRDAQGACCRLLLESSGVVRIKRGAKTGTFRTDKLAAAWVAHLAAHVGSALGAQGLTTLVVSKNGTARFAPLGLSEARQAWGDLLQAWREGMTRPLPFVQTSSDAWWRKVLQAGADSPSDSQFALESAREAARESARKAYEHHDPEHGAFSERESNPCAARAFPDFEALWAAGEFAHWARTLLGPMRRSLGADGPPAAPSAGAQEEAA
jgi:exodeoxyribonuclease V gamma subunit